MPEGKRRFVQAKDIRPERDPWATVEWLSRPDIVQAEQWVENEYRVLQAGEMAHIPMNTIHATFNPFDQDVTFLAILGPAQAPGPDIVDVSSEDPWRTLRKKTV